MLNIETKRGLEMKKNGFTLAEVLITLGIIGTIAAITLPMVTNDAQRRANASRLAASVTTVESGLISMLVEEYADNLGTVPLFEWLNEQALQPADENAIRTEVSRYFKTTNIQFDSLGEVGLAIQDIDGDDLDLNDLLDTNDNDRTTIALRNGAFVTFPRPNTVIKNEDTILQNGGSTNIRISSLLINVNGAEPPNRLGRDVFVFKIGGDGNLYPYGGLTASLLNDGVNVISRDNVFNNAGAGDDFICRDNNQGSGAGCTARLIENNYRFDY